MFYKVILNNGKNKCVVEMGFSFFLNERILFNDGVDKKRTMEERLGSFREMKKRSFFKSNGFKLLDIFTEWTNFLADFVKNDHFYNLTNGFVDQSEIDFSDLFF